jgi:hypothetical protein
MNKLKSNARCSDITAAGVCCSLFTAEVTQSSCCSFGVLMAVRKTTMFFWIWALYRAASRCQRLGESMFRKLYAQKTVCSGGSMFQM